MSDQETGQAGESGVRAARLGPRQEFLLSAPGDDRRWMVVQWAPKPRKNQNNVPWWYEGGAWHLYNGDQVQRTPDGELCPPAESFKDMDAVKAYVAALVAGGPPAG